MMVSTVRLASATSSWLFSCPVDLVGARAALGIDGGGEVESVVAGFADGDFAFFAELFWQA